MKHTAALLLCLASLALPGASLAQSKRTGYLEREDVRAFVADVATRNGLAQRDVERVLASARFQAQVVKLMTPQPRGQRSWQAYRANFLQPRRVDAGIEFWRAHAAQLDAASERFGVPPEIIVSIIGVETEYGRNMGGFRAVDALATLAFDYPRRAEYFRDELEQLILLGREESIDLARLRGSFAGALGIPQFMPGSLRRFAVDFDGDGRRDLLASPADAIGSVANFLREHGWQPGEPIAFPAIVDGDAFRALVDGGVDPVHPAARLRDAGVTFDGAVDAETPTVLIELETPDDAPVYLVGMRNFYVLTRYNRSSFYASAVLELAEAIRRAAPLTAAAR